MVLGYGPLRENEPTEYRLSDHGRDTDVGITIDSSARDPLSPGKVSGLGGTARTGRGTPAPSGGRA